jgi:V-type H+-transporting ATPase subunit G
MIMQHTSGNKKAEEDANKEAEIQVKKIREAGKKGEDEVVQELLGGVFDVKPVVPERIEVPL